MNNNIQLKAAYIHPSENIGDYEELGRFKETITFAKKFELGTYCLYGEKEPQRKLLSIANHDGVFHHLIRKQYLLNTLTGIGDLSLTQYSALISVLTRKEGEFAKLENPLAAKTPIVKEVTSQTFGWLLWSWQIMALVSYYLPTTEPNTFINALHADNKGAWELLTETNTGTGGTLYEVLEQHSLGLKFNTPSYYFGEQLQQLINL